MKTIGEQLTPLRSTTRADQPLLYQEDLRKYCPDQRKKGDGRHKKQSLALQRDQPIFNRRFYPQLERDSSKKENRLLYELGKQGNFHADRRKTLIVANIFKLLDPQLRCSDCERRGEEGTADQHRLIARVRRTGRNINPFPVVTIHERGRGTTGASGEGTMSTWGTVQAS